MMTEQNTAEKWNAMNPEERKSFLRKSDSTMRAKTWQPLIERMSRCRYEELSALQQEMVGAYL